MSLSFQRSAFFDRLQRLVAGKRSAWFRWTLSICLFAIALGLRIVLNDRLPAGFPYLTFFPAIIVTTLVGGLWPGVLAGVLGGIASWGLFINPAKPFDVAPGSLLALGFYTFIVSVDILIIHSISVTSRALLKERQALAALAASKERENIQLLENDALQKEMSIELAHRLKNQLALVQAIVNQTVRTSDDPSTLAQTLSARIGVLAQAHDLLIHGDEDEATVDAVVKQSIALYDRERFVLSGPMVRIDQRPGVSLALMMHELGTNAAKYGALSNDTGQVRIEWAVSRGAEPRFEITWSEKGGPAVTEPTRRGAGSRLISAGVGGVSDVTIEYRSEGVVCTLTAPLEQLSS